MPLGFLLLPIQSTSITSKKKQFSTAIMVETEDYIDVEIKSLCSELKPHQKSICSTYLEIDEHGNPVFDAEAVEQNSTIRNRYTLGQVVLSNEVPALRNFSPDINWLVCSYHGWVDKREFCFRHTWYFHRIDR